MNETETFPTEEFYEALMSSSGLEEKLQIVLKQIKTKNMQMTYQSIVHIHQILNSKLEPPLMKFNALNCAKIFFDTCEYSVILFIEVYLLPIIFEIAAFKSTKKSDEGLSLYFIERGAQPTKQVKKLGLSYVSLAIQFIYATSQVKSYRVLQNQQLQQESNFKKIAKALKMRGVPMNTTYKFYHSNQIEQTRRIYLDKLQIFNPENLIDFVSDLIFGQLTQGKHLQLDSKRLIMFGDVYIISPLIGRIQEELNQIDGNFEAKRKVLMLLFELIRFGYAQAILLLNSSQFLNAITTQVAKVRGDNDMDEGRLIYQQVEDTQKSKKAFYLDFLKCIETWNHAVPLNQQNQQSDAKKLYEYLKFQKKFKFPQNLNMHKYKSEMQIYLRQNMERNEKVIQIINNREEDTQTKSRYKISSLKDQSNIKNQTKKTLEFEELQDIVINAMRILEVVGFNQNRFDKEMKRLLKFKKNWHKNLQLVKKSISEQDQPYNLDMLISEGEIVYDQIVGIQKIYDEHKSNKITFQEAQDKITVFLNQLDEQNPTSSQVSVSAKSKNTRLTNRRDIKSKISQRARDRSVSDRSKHSYVSQSKSAKSNLKAGRANNQPQKKVNPTKNIDFQNDNAKKLAYNPNDDTFAFNSPIEKNTLMSLKKSKNNPSTQLQKRDKGRPGTKLIQNFIQNETSLKNLNEYGMIQVKKIAQPSTATFVPAKDSEVSLKNQTAVDESKRLNEIKKNISQKPQQVKKANRLQKFEDSFEIQSSVKKSMILLDTPKQSQVKKKQSKRIVFSSEDEDPISKPFQKKQSPKIPTQNEKLTKKKQSIIKKILSSQKINFQKSPSSQSQDEQFTPKAQNNNIKISKFTSINNGNVSGYFNEMSIEQYGFAGNIKQSFRNKTPLENGSSEKNSSKIKQNTKQSKFEDVSNKKIMQKFSINQKVNSSRQISQIRAAEASQRIPSLLDFQIANVENFNQKSQKSKLSRQMNESQFSSVLQVDLTEKIKDQDSFQMLQSHYKTKQIEKQKLQPKQQSSENQIKFGQIVQVRKQIIYDRQGVLSPYNQQQSKDRKNRMRRLMQLQNNLNLQNSSKKNNLFEVLSQRSAKKGIQDYMIQKEKNKLIKNLNLRIKKLENEEMTIQTKLSKKDEELRSMSFKNYSQKHRMKFMQENSGNCSIDNSMRDNEESNTSIYYKFNSNKPAQNAKITSFVLSQNPKSNQQNVVNVAQYNQFFEPLVDNAIKKNCLKNKSLIYVNEEMEIGCMSIKKDKFINFTLFVTPKHCSIKNVKISVQKDENLSINVYPDILYSIKAKKQQTINIKILIQSTPYYIPKLTLNYQIEPTLNGKSSSYLQNRFASKLEVILPCTFNKLCTFTGINGKDFQHMFNSSGIIDQNNMKRCQKFKINHRIFKEEKFKEYFPYLTLLKKKQDQVTGKSKIIYGFQTSYNGNLFLTLLRIEDRKYATIQCKNMTAQPKTQKCIQFFMATFKCLLS